MNWSTPCSGSTGRREECQRDVIELVGELAVRGLVEINDAPAG